MKLRKYYSNINKNLVKKQKVDFKTKIKTKTLETSISL